MPRAVSQRCPLEQATQAPPAAPQAVLVAVTHWPFEQQPFVHDVPLHEHCPDAHSSLGPQTAHAWPFLPQAAAVGLVTQWPLVSQHPPAHV